MNTHVLFKLKDGKLQQWKDWCAFLMAHEDEVRDTLRQEKTARERSVLFADTYVLGFQEWFETPVKGDDRELNQKHRQQIADCLERVSVGEVLYDFVLS